MWLRMRDQGGVGALQPRRSESGSLRPEWWEGAVPSWGATFQAGPESWDVPGRKEQARLLHPFTPSLPLITALDRIQKATPWGYPKVSNRILVGAGIKTWRPTWWWWVSQVFFPPYFQFKSCLKTVPIVELCTGCGQKKPQKKACFFDQRTRKASP